MGSTDTTSRLEPTGTSKWDKKPSDGISYYPFKNGKYFARDYTCPNSLGRTRIKVSTFKEAGKAASLAEAGKLKKYKHLNKDYHVILVGMLGSYGPHALNFIKDNGRRITDIRGEKRSTSYTVDIYI